MDKYIKDGQVAVLYSPGYGAGWSSWARGPSATRCLFEPAIVELVLLKQEAEKNENDKEVNRLVTLIENKADELYKDDNFYTGGASGLEIEWITPGTAFKINEYDGSESIEIYSEESFYVA